MASKVRRWRLTDVGVVEDLHHADLSEELQRQTQDVPSQIGRDTHRDKVVSTGNTTPITHRVDTRATSKAIRVRL